MAFRASSIDATHPPHRIEGAESAITCPTEGVAFDMVWRYPAGGKRPLGRSAVTLRMIGSDGGLGFPVIARSTSRANRCGRHS